MLCTEYHVHDTLININNIFTTWRRKARIFAHSLNHNSKFLWLQESKTCNQVSKKLYCSTMHSLYIQIKNYTFWCTYTYMLLLTHSRLGQIFWSRIRDGSDGLECNGWEWSQFPLQWCDHHHQYPIIHTTLSSSLSRNAPKTQRDVNCSLRSKLHKKKISCVKLSSSWECIKPDLYFFWKKYSFSCSQHYHWCNLSS